MTTITHTPDGKALCDRCQHHQADYLAKWPDRAPFNGSTEFYCHGCYEEYEAGAQEVDAHEAGLAAQGIHSGYCVRPELIPLPPGPAALESVYQVVETLLDVANLSVITPQDEIHVGPVVYAASGAQVKALRDAAAMLRAALETKETT